MTIGLISDLEFPLYVCPYTLPPECAQPAGDFFFNRISPEPVIISNGLTTAGVGFCAVAPGPFDYGEIKSSTPFGGATAQLPQMSYDGQAVWQSLNVIDSLHIGFYLALLVPFGRLTGSYNIPPGLVSTFGNPTGPTTSLGLASGISPFTQTQKRASKVSLFCNVPETPVFLCSINGELFDSQKGGDSVFLGINLPVSNIFATEGSVVCNEGILFGKQAGGSGFPPLFIPWAFANAAIAGEVPSGVTPEGVIPGDAFLNDALQNTGQFSTAFNFFILTSNTEVFPGQLQTPVIWAPSRNGYYRVKFTPQTPLAATLLADPTHGLQYSYSQGGYWMLYSNYILGQTFTTQSLSLSLDIPSILPPPVLKLPCFNPCVPNIVLPQG